MTRIIVDDGLRTKLRNLVEPLELCDESGRVLAHLTPRGDDIPRDLRHPQVSDEELRRRANSNSWHTTEEVLAHLKSLEDS